MESINRVGKPTFPDGYRDWLRSRHSVILNNTHRNHYNAVAVALAEAFKSSAFWKETTEQLREIDDAYTSKRETI